MPWIDEVEAFKQHIGKWMVHMREEAAAVAIAHETAWKKKSEKRNTHSRIHIHRHAHTAKQVQRYSKAPSAIYFIHIFHTENLQHNSAAVKK